MLMIEALNAHYGASHILHGVLSDEEAAQGGRARDKTVLL
jgi:hypothetical protein